MPLARHHIYLFIVCLCIIVGLVLAQALAVRSVSADEAVQVAISDAGVRERIGDHFFEAGEAVLDSPFTSVDADISPREVWVVPVTIHNGTSAEIYHVDVTRNGVVYGISRPLHIEYSPALSPGKP